MHFNRLEYFVMAAEELSFTRAAEKMFVSQTTISQQIALLEKELDSQLFRRINSKVELIKSGTVFYEEAVGILKKYQLARYKVKDRKSVV